jgi:hypothetical protein
VYGQLGAREGASRYDTARSLAEPFVGDDGLEVGIGWTVENDAEPVGQLGHRRFTVDVRPFCSISRVV